MSVSNFKTPMFRSPKLLKHAKGSSCKRCMNAYETVVPAHSNWHEHGKGTSLKAHDCFVAFLCQRCHDEIDGRVKTALSPEERKEEWRKAHDATILYLFLRGFIKVT